MGVSDFSKKFQFRISTLRVAKVTGDVGRGKSKKKNEAHAVTSAIVGETLYPSFWCQLAILWDLSALEFWYLVRGNKIL